jgi:hypothetical protein
MITSKLQMVLYLPDRDREQKGIIRDGVPCGIVSEELVYLSGDGELAALSGLLFRHIQAVSLTVPDDILHTQPNDIANTHPKIRLCC